MEKERAKREEHFSSRSNSLLIRSGGTRIVDNMDRSLTMLLSLLSQFGWQANHISLLGLKQQGYKLNTQTKDTTHGPKDVQRVYRVNHIVLYSLSAPEMWEGSYFVSKFVIKRV